MLQKIKSLLVVWDWLGLLEISGNFYLQREAEKSENRKCERLQKQSWVIEFTIHSQEHKLALLCVRIFLYLEI